MYTPATPRSILVFFNNSNLGEKDGAQEEGETDIRHPRASPIRHRSWGSASKPTPRGPSEPASAAGGNRLDHTPTLITGVFKMKIEITPIPNSNSYLWRVFCGDRCIRMGTAAGSEEARMDAEIRRRAVNNRLIRRSIKDL